MDIKQRMHSGWDLVAAGYDQVNAHFVALGRRLAERAALYPGDQVLDVACGTGAVTLAAAARVAPDGHVTGIDLAPGMLARARANAQAVDIHNVDFQEMDAEHLSFSDESFTAALCGIGLFFLPHMDRGLAEIRRVLHPGGRLAFTAYGRGFLEPVNHLLAARMKAYELPPNPLVRQMSWDPAVLSDLVEESGFFLVRAELEDGEVVFPTATAWWDMLWHGAFRAFAFDADPAVIARFREEHLAEVAPLVAPDGLHVRLPVITVWGVRG
jgi:ubiquinone/menaquinone biosynthesis C-methylase UbiE